MDASFPSGLASLLGQALAVRDCCASGRCWPGCLGRFPGKGSLLHPLVAPAPVALEKPARVVALRRRVVRDDREDRAAEAVAEGPLAAAALAHLVDDALPSLS